MERLGLWFSGQCSLYVRSCSSRLSLYIFLTRPVFLLKKSKGLVITLSFCLFRHECFDCCEISRIQKFLKGSDDPVPAQLSDLLGEREEKFVLERLVVAHDLDDDGQVVDARRVPHA